MVTYKNFNQNKFKNKKIDYAPDAPGFTDLFKIEPTSKQKKEFRNVLGTQFPESFVGIQNDEVMQTLLLMGVQSKFDFVKFTMSLRDMLYYDSLENMVPDRTLFEKKALGFDRYCEGQNLSKKMITGRGADSEVVSFKELLINMLKSRHGLYTILLGRSQVTFLNDLQMIEFIVAVMNSVKDMGGDQANFEVVVNFRTPEPFAEEVQFNDSGNDSKECLIPYNEAYNKNLSASKGVKFLDQEIAKIHALTFPRFSGR